MGAAACATSVQGRAAVRLRRPEAAEAEGFSQDICAYARTDFGADITQGGPVAGLPPPDGSPPAFSRTAMVMLAVIIVTGFGMRLHPHAPPPARVAAPRASLSRQPTIRHMQRLRRPPLSGPWPLVISCSGRHRGVAGQAAVFRPRVGRATSAGAGWPTETCAEHEPRANKSQVKVSSRASEGARDRRSACPRGGYHPWYRGTRRDTTCCGSYCLVACCRAVLRGFLLSRLSRVRVAHGSSYNRWCNWAPSAQAVVVPAAAA